MTAIPGARRDAYKRALECQACADATAADELAALRAAIEGLADEWEREGIPSDPYHALSFTFASDQLRALIDGATP